MSESNRDPFSEGREFASREKAFLTLGENLIHESYWQQRLGGELPVFELLPKSQKPIFPGNGAKTIRYELSKELSDWVRYYSKSQSLQPSAIFLAVFKLLLRKYTGLEDIIVGVIDSNDGAHDSTGDIGDFTNIVPIRTEFEDGIEFGEFLQKVQTNVTDAFEHTSCPFPVILEKLNLKETEKDKIFRVTYAYQDSSQRASFSSKQLSGTQTQRATRSEHESELTLQAVETQSAFTLYLSYESSIYSSEVIDRFFDNYCVLLSEVSKAPERVADAYPVIREQEKRKLLIDFNNTQFDYPKDKCIHQLFAERAMAQPDKTAVAFENEQLTYQQLHDKCCDLALFLQSLGIKPNSLVALCLERSIEMMVGIQGILIAGGAYVPIDPDYPDDRLSYMLEDSQASIVLCQGRLKQKLTSLVTKETNLIALDEDWNWIAARAEALRSQQVRLHSEVQPLDLAYVIYTSGSTGRPKGVMVEHQALMNRIAWMQRMYPLDERDVVLQKTPFSFDVSVWEFVWPMMAGSTVVFAKPGGHKDVLYLENLIRESNVTTLHFVPSMLNIYLDHAQNHCHKVRQIFCSGEALDSKSATEYKTRFPNACLHNLYGPTEAAIDVTFFDCSQLHTPFVPIGAPISNIQIYILDKYHNPQPLGVAGELFIAGDGLARGYHNRHELTSERFVANPFNPGARMYKSGDLARWMEDGNIEYLGRIDTQVKIRGFRIETGEIEIRLNQHPEINNSCVVVQGQDAEKRLIAFYHAKNTKPGSIFKLPIEDLRSHLLQALPEYMAPAAYVSLEAFPLTPNGKLNRSALECMHVQIESSQAFLAPRDATEQLLIHIWAEVLNIEPERIGINDNFFELGGHSLMITQLISKIRNQLEVDLPLNAFFDLYTIAGIAEIIKAVNYHGDNEFGDVEFEDIII